MRTGAWLSCWLVARFSSHPARGSIHISTPLRTTRSAGSHGPARVRAAPSARVLVRPHLRTTRALDSPSAAASGCVTRAAGQPIWILSRTTSFGPGVSICRRVDRDHLRLPAGRGGPAQIPPSVLLARARRLRSIRSARSRSARSATDGCDCSAQNWLEFRGCH